MYLLSQIKRNPAITTVTKRGIFGGGRGLFSSSLRNIKTLLIYESGSLGSQQREQVTMPLGHSLNDEGIRCSVFGGLYALQLDQSFAQ